MRTSFFRFSAAVLISAYTGLAISAEQVTILTSFPKELTEAYKKGFEAKYPDITVEVLNKSTSSAISYAREAEVGQRPDVFWVSAPDAFEVLVGNKMLLKVKDLANPEIPDKVGSFPVNDPEGYFLGQALAGYGNMWNTRYLQANKLPEPREWADLTKPEYFSHVAMSAPSRSGTTHLTVETILQGEGWTKGWEQLLQIAGNCAAITERSFGVPDGVNNGQFGVGLVIDFFGLASKYSGFPTDFHYPTVTAIVPANIGLLVGSKNVEAGKKFIRYALSNEGQELLLSPNIARLPVLPSTYRSSKLPKGYPNAYEIAGKAKVKFDTELSKARYHMVNALFDQTVTFRLKELQAAANAIHNAERKLAGKSNKKAEGLLAKARTLAYTPLVDEKQITDKAFLKVFTKKKKDVEVSKEMAGYEEKWSSAAKDNYEKAVKLAEDAAKLAEKTTAMAK